MNIFKSNCSTRRGFTLIELLMVIAIIGVLSTMALGIMRKAQIDARESATEARILQIESILQIQLEDYEVRRLPIGLRELANYCNGNRIHADLNLQMEENLVVDVRNMKRRILMDIINAEMPRPLVDTSMASGFDYNPDVGVFPTTQPGYSNPMGFRAWIDTRFIDPLSTPNGPQPPLGDRLEDLTPAKVQSWRSVWNKTTEDFDLPGEYLYEILARIDIDGTPAVELLGNATIGNSDDDEFLEVVDAWGDPMSLRIWQVDAVPASGVVDVWNDVPHDFEQPDPSVQGFPLGYTVIDPTVPREISKIRFEVRSENLFEIDRK